jgi:hypothetical protein
MKPPSRPSVVLAAGGLLFLLGAAPASAAPSPVDGPPPARSEPQAILTTPFFAPGEVDLSTLGVSATDLLSVGPRAALAPTSGSGMRIVDDNHLDCPNAQYMTVQSAVTAANPGDKIKVCPGTYIEQVTVPAGKNGLTIFAEGALQPVIKAPPAMTAPEAIVRINGAQDVTISHLTISGPGDGGCNSIRYGVFVYNGGSALITDNHITHIRDAVLSGCQNGLAVAVGRNLLPDGPTIGSGTVVHNLIDDYQKGGVLVDNTGSSAEVAYNEIVGAGPTPLIAQNGSQVSRGAQGEVHHSKVSQNIYGLTTTESTGILLYTDPDENAHHNDTFSNQTNIGLFVVDGTVEVSYNNARDGTYGVVAYSDTRNNLISHNKAFENTLDCRDDTDPTLNDWVKDLGRTENQAGLCKEAGPQ